MIIGIHPKPQIYFSNKEKKIALIILLNYSNKMSLFIKNNEYKKFFYDLQSFLI